MILGYHVIFGAYGFWLPNDPRGSWSDFVRSWELVRFGQASKVSTRASLAHMPHDGDLRRAAKTSLAHRPVHFNGRQAQAVGNGFARAAVEGGYGIHACSILPEHVHLVLGQANRSPRRIVGHLKGRATQALRAAGLHPLAKDARNGETMPSPWARGNWTVYQDTPAEVRRAIAYVEGNPMREGKPRQRWSFVTAY